MGAPAASLDQILALQLSVAWAGEARARPARLSWWQTDLVDPEGGGDLLSRLAPRTHAWAALDAVREAARRVDDKVRRGSGTPDRLVTLFHLGFELDEEIAQRLSDHRRHQLTPADALGPSLLAGGTFDRSAFEAFLRQSGPAPRVESAPAGRRILDPAPGEPLLRAKLLVAALAPLASEYPMPHFYIDGAAPDGRKR